MGMMAGTVLPMLFNATESRQRQDAIALVEQNGAQVMQTIVRSIRQAERVLYPVDGKDGYILALQMDTADDNPTIIAKDRGSIVLARGNTRRNLNSDLVGVTHFSVTNTAISDTRQSVAISLGMRRIIRVLQPVAYEATFNTVVVLHPDDDIQGDTCGDDPPIPLSAGYPDCLNDGDAVVACTNECIAEIDDDPDDLSNPPDLCDDTCEADCAEGCANVGTFLWFVCDEQDPNEDEISTFEWVPQSDFRCDLIDED